MRVDIKPGKYVVAVSGGVDSMVLLDLLAKKPDIRLIVAHFNHGIRPDSAKDEELVRRTALRTGLTFKLGYGRLGPGSSEETARKARYKFLKEVKNEYGADSIITAHHQDDLIETALLNTMRGTGRKGLVAIAMNQEITRPLLRYKKEEIMRYAAIKGIEWREDGTNDDNKYLRNAVRKELQRRLTSGARDEIVKNIENVAKIQHDLEDLIAKLSHNLIIDTHISRDKFALLPVDVANELIAYWLRERNVKDFDNKTINRLNIALRTFKAGTICPVKGSLKLRIGIKTAEFTTSP